MSKVRSELGILFSIVVLDTISFGILIPLLPFFAKYFNASAGELGLLLTSYAAVQVLFLPIWGKLSDKYGRKNILVTTMALSSLCLLVVAFANSLFWLFIGRILGGICAANISVASAYVTDITSREDRSKGMGMIGASFGIGFVIGPFIAATLSKDGFSLPLIVASCLTFSSSVLAFFILRNPKDQKKKGLNPRKNFKELIKVPQIKTLYSISFIFTLAVAQMETVFAYFILHRFNYSVKEAGYLMGLMAIIMIIIQGGLVRKLSAKKLEKEMITFGSGCLAIGMLALPYSETLFLLILSLCVMALGRGLVQPAAMSLVSVYAPKDNEGAVMGGYQSSASMARVIGPAIAGFSYDQSLFLPFWIGFIALSSIILLLAKKKHNPESKPENSVIN